MLLDVYLLVPVDHDLRDLRVGQQILQRSKAEHVVDDDLDHPLPLLTGHGDRLLGHHLVHQLGNALADHLRGDVLGVVGQLLDETLVDLGAQG